MEITINQIGRLAGGGNKIVKTGTLITRDSKGCGRPILIIDGVAMDARHVVGHTIFGQQTAGQWVADNIDRNLHVDSCNDATYISQFVADGFGSYVGRIFWP